MSVLDVTTAVHFYEAILATFSILIWHFYFVIFDPDVYPLKWTVLTGRAPEHEVREEEEEEPVPVVAGEAKPTEDGPGETPALTNLDSKGDNPAPSSQPDSSALSGAKPRAGTSPPGVKPSKPN